MYVYIYICIGGWGSESNREIVFVSFVRACVRAGGRGEAKLRAGARRRCFRGWVSGPGIVLRRRRALPPGEK